MNVKWKWWYPAGCFDSGHVDTDEFDSDPFDGEEAAAEIVQRYIDKFGTDSSSGFDIEILEPASLAGVYAVELDWEPTTVATKRESSPAPQSHQTEGER